MFFSAQIVRKSFFFKKTDKKILGERRVYSNKTTIPTFFLNKETYVYNGKFWNKKYFSKFHVGFKFGEFKWSRKIAMYKVKQKKKK